MQPNSKTAYNILYILTFATRGKGNTAPFIDVAPSTRWAGVKTGRFPQPVRMGSMTFWRGADFLKLVGTLSPEVPE